MSAFIQKVSLFLVILLCCAAVAVQAQPLVLFSTGPGSAVCNDLVTIQITAVSGYTNIGTLQYSVNWDQTKLQYVSNTATTVDGDVPIIGTANTAIGQLVYSWADADFTPYGANLPGNTVLFTVTLRAISSSGSATVNITNTPAIIEATDGNFNNVTVTTQNNTSIALSPIPLSITAYNGLPFTAVCSGVAAGFQASAAAGGMPNVQTYAWSATNLSGGAGPTFTYTGAAGTAGGATNTQQANITWNNTSGMPKTETVTLTVTFAGGCVSTTTTTIVVNPLPVLSVSVTNIVCNGSPTGAIDLSVSSGLPAYTYDWSNDGPENPDNDPQDLANLLAGTYTVTVTDANGCMATTSATITQLSALSLSIVSVTNVACNGASTGVVFLSVSGGTPGYTYDWSNDGPETPDNDTQNLSGVAAGTYTVTVTDANGCTATISATVTQAAALNLSIVSVTNVSCSGGSNGAIDLNVTGGTGAYTYDWSNDGPETPDNDTQDLAGLTFGTYTVTVTDAAGCTSTTSATVTQPTALSLSFVSVTNVLCNGAATGAIDLNVTGGTPAYTYDWSNDGPETPDNDPQDLTGLIAGTYFVTVTDANGCTAANSATVTQPPALSLSIVSVTNVSCNGGSNGAIDLNATGGTGAYTYDWSNDGPETPDNDPQDLANLLAGTYTVTVTDANGCTSTTAATVTQPTALSLSIISVTNVSCFGGSNGSAMASVNGGTPGYTYDWSNDGPENPDNDTPMVTGLSAGTYTVTITDANGCTASSSVTITQPTILVLSTTFTPACAGVSNGTIDLTVSGGAGGYTYDWSNDGPETPDNDPQDLSGLAAGTYTVTVTDANGCTMTTSTTIVQSSLINLSTTSMPTCAGTSVGTIDLTVSGGIPGYTYDWSNDGPENPDNDPQDLNGLAAGVYTVTVTDANTCTATTSVTITANPTPTVNAVANQTFCSGASTTLIAFSGTPANVVFNWTNNTTSIGLAAAGAGNIASFVAVNNGTVPVVATITVTPSATNGGTTCTGAAITFTITVNPLPTVFNVTGGGVVCTTDNIGVPVGLSGSQTGVNYQLLLNAVNTGAPVAGTGAAISFGPQLAAGTYTVVATSTLGGCTRQMNASATVSTFNCTVVISDPCVCLNNATTLTNGQFGETVKVNAPGTQTWTVTAINGLYSSASLPPPAAPTPIAVGTTLLNIGGNMFTLTGKHVDAIGYTLTVSNAMGTVLSIGNTCQYPNPEITSDLSGAFCLYSNPVDLTGNPGDANIVSQGFTVNGVPATQFNPAAGVGQYVITYTVDGGVPKAFGPNDPGCVQSVSTFVNVIATPNQLVCNDLLYVSLDIDCVNEVLPDDVLEGSYGCYDDYLVEVDKTLPYGNGPWVPATLGVGDLGFTYQYRVTHLVSGNKCWGNLKLEDKFAPTIECSDIDLSCAITTYDPAYLQNVLGIGSAYPDVFDCTPTNLVYIDTWHDLACNQGFNGHPDLSAYVTRKWTVTDAWGNTATCIQYIYFERRHIGDVLFPSDVTISCSSSSINTDPSNTGAPYIDDFGFHISLFPNNTWCEMQAAYVDQILPVCDGTYKILRTWTVIDWCLPTTPFPPTSNPMYFIQLIKIIDDQGPVLACPANMTVSTDPFNCCATTDLPDIIIRDNCSRINNISAMVIAYDPYTGDQGPMYIVGGTLTTFPGNNYWDLDTLGNWGYTPCLPQGTHTVIYTAEDDCGNTSTCSFRLTVRDYVAPVAACDEFTVVGIGTDDPFDCYTPADGCSGAGVTWVKATTFDDGSYDNCNNLHFTVRRMEPYSDCINNLEDCEKPNATEELDSIKFYCCEVGTIQTVILRVYQVDFNGDYINGPDGTPVYNECMVNVSVQDKIKPVCISPANMTVACENFDPSLWVYGIPSIADNCCLDTTKVYQNQCGLTHTVNYSLFDTVCNKGTIVRTFRAFDCHGLSSQCTQRIVVNYNQNYFVKFPNDVIVTTCDGTGNYGEPFFFGKDCELLGVNYEDQIFTVVPDACFKIERTWTIINWCTYNPNLPCIEVPNPNPNPIANHPSNLPGPTVSACGTLPPWAPTVVKINPTDATATNYCTFWDANANCYKYKQIIKVIDTQDPVVQCPASPVEFCDLTPNNAQLWNEMYWWDNVIGSHDLCEGPADLCITGTDACSGANINIHYLLFLDLDGDGVMETVINSINTGIAGLGWNNLYFNNAGNPNFSGGIPRGFDERGVPFNQKYGFAIQNTVSGNNKTACVRWNTQQSQNTYVVPELPYGTHKIKWFVEDGCGNETICEYTFIVKDCKKPTVVCLNGLSVNIMPTGMISLWASDFLQYGEDNCTPADQLKYGIRKSGTGTGFPVDANGNPITSVTFTCDELGTQLVELWAIDKAGNADYCETYVIVQDNMGNCGPISGAAQVAGVLSTEATNGVSDGSVGIAGGGAGIPNFNFTDMSDNAGHYSFNAIPTSSSSTVTPVKDDNPLNGVSTYDLVLISKHILGLQPLNSPYKMIAADANKNNSITTTDIVEFRKLILGIYTELPNNTSWRFVDAEFAFPNPANPFSTTFPENKTIANIQANQMGEDFVSVKIGDVNGSAIANATMSADDRSTGTLLFDVEDRDVKAGETFTLNFKAAERVQGYQFTMNFQNLEVVDVTPGANMKLENFGIFQDAITTSFDGDVQGEFGVTFRATKAGKISDMLKVSSQITRAEAYSNSNEKLDVAFRFNNGATSTISGVGFELYQNQPNPFVNKTFIGFHLPTATEATLTIYDETGRMLFTQKGDFAKGYNSIAIDRALISTTGVLYYKLETATDSATKKMIQTK